MLRRDHPEIIFANIVNELMVAVPSAAYARAMNVVTPRKVWLSQEGDVIVTPRPVDDFFKRYACSTLGVDPDEVVTLTPEGAASDLLPVAVMKDERMLARLRALIAERPGIDLLGFALDRHLLKLVETLEVPLHGYSAPPSAGLRAVLYDLNTKSGFRRAAEKLGLRIVPGAYCEGLADLTKNVAEIIKHTGGVIVKMDRSSNGFYHIIFRLEDVGDRPLRDYLSERLAAYPEQPQNYTVEALMPFVSVPSVELTVEEAGGRLLYLCDQRCPNNSFTGMLTPPPDLPPHIEEELLRVGRLFGDYVHAAGFRGVCDVDVGVVPDETVYVTETNFRRTGGTYLDTLMRRFIGEDYLRTHVWWADSRIGEGGLQFSEGCAAVAEARLAFDPAQGAGIILTADTVSIDGKWRYLIIARSHQEADHFEKGLERVLRLREFA